jgi:hypothetical protein
LSGVVAAAGGKIWFVQMLRSATASSNDFGRFADHSSQTSRIKQVWLRIG